MAAQAANNQTRIRIGRSVSETESDNAHPDLVTTTDALNPNIVAKLFPVLSVVAHARDKLIPVNCTFRAICGANKMLVDKFGDVGRSVAALISTEMGKMLINSEPRRGPITLKRVNKVAQLGRSGFPCDILFKDCEALSFLPRYVLPPSGGYIPVDHPLLRKSGVVDLLGPLQYPIHSRGPPPKSFLFSDQNTNETIYKRIDDNHNDLVRGQ